MNYGNYKIETYIPEESFLLLREKLNEIGALTIDKIYDNCITTSKVVSYWRPLKGSNPYSGEVGKVFQEDEIKVEFCCSRNLLNLVIDIIKNIHPYEKPVIIVMPIISI